MRTFTSTLALVTLAAMLAACSQPPTEAVAAAEAALESVQNADAETYAPEALQAARDARAALDTEMAAQQSKFALMRSYDRAAQLAQEAEAAAAAALEAATVEKARARDEATQMVADVRLAITEARGLLDAAPVGKGSTADLAVMRADLDAAELSLNDAEADLLAERYADARAKAEAARAVADGTRDAVMQAQGMVAGAR